MKRRTPTLGLQTPGRLRFPFLLGPVAGQPVHDRIRLAVDERRRLRQGVPELDVPTAPPPRFARDGDPIDLVLVIDESGSTTSTDPFGYRHVAARRIVNLLVDGINGQPLDDRVGVIHFSDEPQPWLALTPLGSKAGRFAVRNALRPIRGGGTRIVPAVRRAAQILDTGGHRQAVVLLFSDGESAELAAELTAVVSELPPGAVHVAVLGERLPNQWYQVPIGSVTPITRLTRPADVEWIMARALYSGLGLEWLGPETPPAYLD